MNKKIYFISGFPRAGNTVLASILNQNKKIKTTAHSLLPDIIYTLDKLKQKPIYKNFPDEKSFNNMVENIFNNYYKIMGRGKRPILESRIIFCRRQIFAHTLLL